MLTFEQVTRTYPDGPDHVDALARLNLTVADGEFVTVMGPSGSGKSTVVNLAAGLDMPDSGRILVDGIDLAGQSLRERARLRRRRIGLLQQDANLDPVLTAVENVALPMRLDGVGERHADENARVALERCAIAELVGRFPDQLSGGQRQRVALARAIVGERTLILADEPTAGLDTPTGRALVELLAAMAAEGISVLMTTHDSRLAGFADRVVLLRDGRQIEPSRSSSEHESLQ